LEDLGRLGLTLEQRKRHDAALDLNPVYNTASKTGRSAMPARLNITMDPKLYRRLKEEVPPKKISAFIEAAVRARLAPDAATLDAAYKAARKESWRGELSLDWSATEMEGWTS